MAKRSNLEEVVRARVTELQKKRLAEIAASRQLSPSDIIREAINRYLASKAGVAQ